MAVYLEVHRLVDQKETQIDSSPRKGKGGKPYPMQNIKDLQVYFILLVLWASSTGWSCLWFPTGHAGKVAHLPTIRQPWGGTISS